jgi:epoxyqueuosine reductase QueG
MKIVRKKFKKRFSRARVMRMSVRKLTDEVTALALKTGAELVGFASAEKLEREAPVGHRPSDLLKGSKSVVMLSCGRSLNEDREYVYNWGPDYSLTYIRLKDEIKWRRRQARGCIDAVKSFLQEKGYNVVTEPHGWSGILSFKTAAYLAGQGVFGRGSFIVHPKLGPLNVLACILTDAELEYAKPLSVDVCKDCLACVEACKYGAFRKESDDPPRAVYRWLGEKCRCYDLIMNPVTLKWTYGPCNSKCAQSCPIGK